jgi:hypothetical protein
MVELQDPMGGRYGRQIQRPEVANRGGLSLCATQCQKRLHASAPTRFPVAAAVTFSLLAQPILVQAGRS